MIHWAFLVLTFVAGFVGGCAFLYQMARVAAQVERAIEDACRQITL